MITQKYVKSLLHYDPLSGYLTWKVSRRNRTYVGKRVGYKQKNGYRRVKINGRYYRETKIIWLWMTGNWPNPEIDHKNRIRDDNRWDNLREVTRYENNLNKAPRKNGLPRGVSKARGNKYRARSFDDGKEIVIGYFYSIDDANNAYQEYIKRKYK